MGKLHVFDPEYGHRTYSWDVSSGCADAESLDSSGPAVDTVDSSNDRTATTPTQDVTATQLDTEQAVREAERIFNELTASTPKRYAFTADGEKLTKFDPDQETYIICPLAGG